MPVSPGCHFTLIALGGTFLPFPLHRTVRVLRVSMAYPIALAAAFAQDAKFWAWQVSPVSIQESRRCPTRWLVQENPVVQGLG
jgi:hypothetical protein